MSKPFDFIVRYRSEQLFYYPASAVELCDPTRLLKAKPKARKILQDIWQAETREAAHRAFDLFIETFEAKYPKATECLIKDRDELLTVYDFPAQSTTVLKSSNDPHSNPIPAKIRPLASEKDTRPCSNPLCQNHQRSQTNGKEREASDHDDRRTAPSQRPEFS